MNHLTWRKCGIALIFLSVLAWFVNVSKVRFVDPDEGFYLLASRLVVEGKQPYVDFFFTQMPLMPYIYGAWLRITAMSWEAGRLLSACFSTALAVLLYVEVKRQTRREWTAILTVVLFAVSTLVFFWFTVVKTYALSMLLLFACYSLLVRLQPRSRGWILIAAGMCLGLSTETRLYFGALLPVFVAWIAYTQPTGTRTEPLLFFLSGAALAGLPSIVFFLHDRQSFLFSNWGFHAMRSGHGLIGDPYQKVMVVIATLAARGTQDGPQMCLLVTAAIFSIQRGTLATRLALLLAAILGMISLLPTPSYSQYFCVEIPFLLVSAVPWFVGLLDRVRPSARFAGAAVLGLYALLGLADFSRNALITGENPIESAGNWNLSSVKSVSRIIDRLAGPNGKVVSFWPGYLLTPASHPVAGFESDSALLQDGALTPDQLQRYHVLSGQQAAARIRSREANVVVLGNQEYLHHSKQDYLATLAEAGYQLQTRVGDTWIFVRP